MQWTSDADLHLQPLLSGDLETSQKHSQISNTGRNTTRKTVHQLYDYVLSLELMVEILDGEDAKTGNLLPGGWFPSRDIYNGLGGAL